MHNPSYLYGSEPWFDAARQKGLITDSKTIVDCTPRRDREEIATSYRLAKARAADFDLTGFLIENYIMPLPASTDPLPGQQLVPYMHSLWKLLRREPDTPISRSSLLALPHSYVVPGGRFREIYYWDSYFTMIGLRVSGDEALIESMVRNFAYLIDTYGH